jgi:glucose/arabinose dehydrogenase
MSGISPLVLIAGFTFAAAAPAADNDGLILPPGFHATVVHEGVGFARHIAIRDNGDLYVATRQPPFGRQDPAMSVGIVALRDTNADGKADIVEHFGEVKGTGVQFYKGMLYASDEVAVYRFRFAGNELVPTAAPETVIGGFVQERQHADKPFAFDGKGHIYVNVGAPANACQEKDRTPGSPGQQPCSLLERYGGIWQFNADRTGQTQAADGVRYATGLRNTVALEWNNAADALFGVMHGRDQLDTLWPKLFTAEDNAERVAEELHVIRQGGEYGWPYTYFDVTRGVRVLAPEYGGDGKTPAERGKYPDPLVAFPAHWAPNDIIFYEGSAFPEAYRGGAFIAFHGSWNRAPLPQAGYKVVFVPFRDGMPSGGWQVFADRFASAALRDNNPANAERRPVGLAVAGDGSLYITDSVNGRIWRVTYSGT